MTLLARYRRALSQLEDSSVPPGKRGDDLRTSTAALMATSLSAQLPESEAAVKAVLGTSTDVITRPVRVGGSEAVLLYLRGLLDDEVLAVTILTPLTDFQPPPGGVKNPLPQLLREAVIAAGSVKTVGTIGEIVRGVLDGDAAILLDGAAEGVLVAIPQAKERSVEEPVGEPTIRGPRAGFTESLRDNTALLRRRLRSPFLKLEAVTLGRSSQTPVVVTYLQDVAAPELVAEVHRRVTGIDVDGIADASMVEALIEDNPYSVFPQIQNTERPDTVMANLLEGRVAILTDGSPFALIVPVTIWSFLQASEDYYERYPMASFLRLLRTGLALMALLGPALWIAMVTYHQELLPTSLLLTVAATRAGIPFPAAVEALIMEVFFEALREAGVRLPRPVGQAVSIVGALVIGEAAVQAGIVSAPMVIVVATTGIASFTVPRFNFGVTLRLTRFLMMLLSAVLGLYGVMIGLLFLLFHLAALRSFGVPYLQPVAPFSPGDMKDTLLRFPEWLVDRRPEFLKVLDRRRHARWQKPEPPVRGGRP